MSNILGSPTHKRRETRRGKGTKKVKFVKQHAELICQKEDNFF